MEFKINEYNDDYIIIESNQIINNLTMLSIEGKTENNELIKELKKISLSINNYEKQERKKGNFYKRVNEVAIDRNSKVGNLIFESINNPEYIEFNHLTHALLKSIYYREFDYYDKLTILIKGLSKINNFKFDYKWFKLTYGEDIANYITNSTYLYPSKSKNPVYLYKNGKIKKTELQKKQKAKTKARTI